MAGHARASADSLQRNCVPDVPVKVTVPENIDTVAAAPG